MIMMAHFIPFEKLSKKEKKKQNNLRRNYWNGIDPSTKIMPNKKKENKKRAPINDNDSLIGVFFFPDCI
jgi:hypothetical protein